MTTADEFDSVQLPSDRSSIVIDQRARTWRRCNSCSRHYLTESYSGACPRCKLVFGARPVRVPTAEELGYEIANMVVDSFKRDDRLADPEHWLPSHTESLALEITSIIKGTK